MIKVDCSQKKIDSQWPFYQPNWLSIVELNLYSNLSLFLL